MVDKMPLRRVGLQASQRRKEAGHRLTNRTNPSGGYLQGGSFIDPESPPAPTFQIEAPKKFLKFFPAQPTTTRQSCHSSDPETRRLGW